MERENHEYLLSVIKEVKAHVLIGSSLVLTSTCPGAFTKEIVRESN